MSNEQDNKPERTAMQQAIDAINNEAHKYPPGADERNALQSMLPKLVKLRDTVEKEGLIGFAAQALADAFEDSPGYQYYDMAETLYNEKYPNYGK